MQFNERLIGVINDLVRINNDRVRGYEQAIDDLGDSNADLKTLFQEKVMQSQQWSSHWATTVVEIGGQPAKDTTVSGKLYRMWMEFKNTITGHDRKAVIDSCIFGEKAALDEYDDALGSDAPMSSEIRQQITEQNAQIQASHDSLKAMLREQEQLA